MYDSALPLRRLPGCEATVLVAPWDLIGGEGRAGGASGAGVASGEGGEVESGTLCGAARAAQVVAAIREAGGPAPMLVLVADVSCSASLIQPLVEALCALRSLLPAGAVALLAHERREGAVDESLRHALAEAKLVAEEVQLEGRAELEGRGEWGKLQVRRGAL